MAPPALTRARTDPEPGRPAANSGAPRPAVIVRDGEIKHDPANVMDADEEGMEPRAPHHLPVVHNVASQAKGPTVNGPAKDGPPPPPSDAAEGVNNTRPSVEATPPQRNGLGPAETHDAPRGEPAHVTRSAIGGAGGLVHTMSAHPSPATTLAQHIAPAAAPQAPVTAERLTEVLANEVLRATPAGEHRLEIVLHPPELGRVELSMVVGRDAIHAQLVAHTEGARDLLTHHLADLRQQLVAQGFADPQLSVDLHHGSGERHWQQPDGGGPGAPRDDNTPPASLSPPPAPRRSDHQLFHRIA
jgi:hypothetical protein